MMGIKRQWEAKPPPPGLAACPIGKQSISICPRSRRALNFFRSQGVGPKISVKGTSAASLPCAMRLARTGCRYCVIEAVGFGLERLMAGEMMPSPNRKLPPSMTHSSSSGRRRLVSVIGFGRS